MTTDRRPGYRGALPPRTDLLGAPWTVTVILIFVAIMVMAVMGWPSGLFPEPTPLPILSPSPTAPL